MLQAMNNGPNLQGFGTVFNPHSALYAGPQHLLDLVDRDVPGIGFLGQVVGTPFGRVLDIGFGEIEILEADLGNAHIVAQPFDGFEGLVRGKDRIHVMDVQPHGLTDLFEALRGVDICFECTGIFASKEKASMHLEAGAKRVLVSAPASGADKTIVYGVNHDTLTADDLVVSNGSCTTNCLAPPSFVLNKLIGIEKGFMTTIHAYTGDQPTLDTLHKDLYRGRAAAMSMIPTSTGAAKAIGLVIPELNGKLDGVAIRVPTPNVSVVDLVFNAGRETSVDEINDAIRKAADGPLKGVLAYTDEKNVSMDFNHDPASSTFATDQTKVMDGKLVRILSWYDNEWGFSNRMLDTAIEMGKYL